MRRALSCLRAALVLAGLCSAPALAAPSDTIDPAIVAAARKEGQVTWYTTLNIDQFVRPAATAFEKKYGIKVNYVRADSNGVVLRIMNEADAGHIQVDTFDGTAGVTPLEQRGLVMKWVPPSALHLGKQFYDPAGYWAATNLYVLTPGYNTSLVNPKDAPKTLEDLLDPKWQGKLIWNASATMSGAGGFIGLVLTVMGEDKGKAYLKQLAKQEILGVQVSARQVLDQVIAGESAIALNIFDNHAVISAQQHAPVAWIPMQPATVVFSAISVTQKAPHPNAGKLLTDFLISDEGQAIFRDANYIPADPNVPPIEADLRPDGVKLKFITFSPEQIQAQMPKWMAIYNETFQ